MRLKIVKGILWFFVGAAAIVGAVRFLKGLGTATALTDTTPWGLWIGFDVMGGVALAAGGFVMAACVYIFHLKKYHPIVRPAVLTAFLGYAAVIVGLVFDVGLPWNLWRPLYSWQHHSALFEVAMCVMFYFHVLALEFAPVIFERLPFKRIYKILKALTIPLVILGIILSTLHQSSLGTLLVIMPFRIHPLWYSTILPIFFFISAVGLGLTMVITESIVSSWLYEKEIEKDLLSGLAKAAAYVLGFYVIVKFADLAYNGKLAYLTDGSWESMLFIFEMLVSAIIPAALFAFPKIRRSTGGLAAGAGLAVFGFVLNRINVSGLSTVTATGTNYFPSWMEIAISVGIVSGAALVFFFFIENFHVYEEPHGDADKDSDLITIHSLTDIRFNLPPMVDFYKYMFIFGIGALVSLGLLSDYAIHGLTPEKTPVENIRRVRALKTARDDGLLYAYSLYNPKIDKSAEKGQIMEVFLLDGDRKNKSVLFNHEEHQIMVGGNCIMCHHADASSETMTACHECHRDMFLETAMIDAEGETVGVPAYRDSMHTLCINCHKQVDVEMERCGTCHPGPDESKPSMRRAYAIIDGST